jgi:hypothetical protein
MAKNPQTRKPTVDQMRAAIPRLTRPVDDLNALNPSKVKECPNPTFKIGCDHPLHSLRHLMRQTRRM